MGGTYLLCYACSESIVRTIGALGDRRMPSGGYVYVGSALGTGGFSRVDRHERVARGDHDVRHWHIDHFATAPPVSLVAERRLPDRAVECALARQLADGPIDGFGASDCGCHTHLAHYPTVEAATKAVDQAIDALDGTDTDAVSW